MFALIQGESIWFRTDEETLMDYRRLGSSPFASNPAMELGSFYEVPSTVRDDQFELVAWAKRAVTAE